MSIVVIGRLVHRFNRKASPREVTWNKKTGLIKDRKYEIGKANKRFEANNMALKYASEERCRFKKDHKTPTPAWFKKIKFGQKYYAGNFFKGSNRALYEARKIEISLADDCFVVVSREVREAWVNGFFASKFERLVFEVDELDPGEIGPEQFTINGVDKNGFGWELILRLPENK